MISWQQWRGRTDEQVRQIAKDVMAIRESITLGMERQALLLEHLHKCLELKLSTQEQRLEAAATQRNLQFDALRVTVVKCIAGAGGFILAVQALLALWSAFKGKP